MLKFNKYHKELLLFLKKMRRSESYHNLLHQESTFILSLLPTPRTSDELKEASIEAQQALNDLIANGYLYDTNGQRWYSLAPKGEKLLASGFVIDEPVDADKLLKEKYEFHPRIKAVSLKLLSDGHYKEAIQAALVEVIDRVKEASDNPTNNEGVALDGDRLMNKVFSCTGPSVPILKLNPLSDGLDKDEQQGFMYLFKGIVGIRNKKAHLNFIQNDSMKTVDYLALASLLMRVLDDEFLENFNS